MRIDAPPPLRFLRDERMQVVSLCCVSSTTGVRCEGGYIDPLTPWYLGHSSWKSGKFREIHLNIASNYVQPISP